MSEDQNQHLKYLNEMFVKLNNRKYSLGAKEHDSNLWEMSVLETAYNLREEAIDQFNYAQNLIDGLEKSIDER